MLTWAQVSLGEAKPDDEAGLLLCFYYFDFYFNF